MKKVRSFQAELSGFEQGESNGTIDHFTVVCSVTWPLNGTKAGGDLALIQTSLP